MRYTFIWADQSHLQIQTLCRILRATATAKISGSNHLSRFDNGMAIGFRDLSSNYGLRASSQERGGGDSISENWPTGCGKSVDN